MSSSPPESEANLHSPPGRPTAAVLRFHYAVPVVLVALNTGLDDLSQE
jgi:hypothetical protein